MISRGEIQAEFEAMLNELLAFEKELRESTGPEWDEFRSRIPPKLQSHIE
jgi:hypothetical protein